jgi:myxalamid-type polyketide synthase MxaE and MxaD/epothilone polyketide synthase D
VSGAWLPAASLRTDAHLRLICLPHAGAGASTYRPWRNELPPEVQLCAVQLPGREDRLAEPAIDDARLLVRGLMGGLRPFLDRPFALFGHSMGGLLAFELACALRRSGLPLPVRLFVSAHRAPCLPAEPSEVHRLPPAEFRAELRQLGGTRQTVLEHEEMMAIAEPILRSDFKLCETYRYEPVDPLNVPLSVFGGTADGKVAESALHPWQQHSSLPIRLRMLDGGHLFVQESRPQLVSALLEDLQIASCRLTL